MSVVPPPAAAVGVGVSAVSGGPSAAPSGVLEMSPMAANALAVYSAATGVPMPVLLNMRGGGTGALPVQSTQPTHADYAAAYQQIASGRGRKAAPATKGRKKKEDGPPSARKRKAGADDDLDDLDDDKRAKAGVDGVAAGGCRYDSSLGLLTKKFVQLLQEASSNGVLDLNQAALKLGVQKRRIYDITNVLEGIGLISKKSKNNIQWRGSGLGPMIDLRREMTSLKDELDALIAEESTLDDYIRHMQDTLAATQEFDTNRDFCYMTHEDIRSVQNFENKIIIAIKAPKGTTLDVPEPEVNDKEMLATNGIKQEHEPQATYQAILKSSGGPIDVFVVSNGPADVPSSGDYSSSFAYPPSASNSPMHQPPLSPIPSTHANQASHHHQQHHHLHAAAAGSALIGGMASVPNSPFALGGSASPYGMIASPAFQSARESVYHQHHALTTPSHHSTIPQANILGSASPMQDIHGAHHQLSHSPPALSVASRLGSPMHRFGGGYSPFTQSSPFRPGGGVGGGLAGHTSSPYGLHLHAASHHAASSSPPNGQVIMKLEPPSNDPDYFMNLEENEGLTDLYAHRLPPAAAADETNKQSSAPDGWPDEADNIFSTTTPSPQPNAFAPSPTPNTK